MDRTRKEFINPHFLAPNVLEIDVAPDIAESLLPLVEALRAVKLNSGPVEIGGHQFDVSCPDGWNSDIRWISQGDLAAYGFFEDLFERSWIIDQTAQYIDHDKRLRFYSGFFVTRSFCHEPLLHHDWVDARNDAFNVMIPISDNCADMGVVYRDLRGQLREYQYRPGKALLIGDRFFHSTAAGRTEQPTVLLSFCFGTDRMDRWDALAQTAARQGRYYRRPDGEFVTRT